MITLIHCLFLQAVILNFINLFMSYSFKGLSIKYVHTDGVGKVDSNMGKSGQGEGRFDGVETFTYSSASNF